MPIIEFAASDQARPATKPPARESIVFFPALDRALGFGVTDLNEITDPIGSVVIKKIIGVSLRHVSALL
jgi:hypothetical protein